MPVQLRLPDTVRAVFFDLVGTLVASRSGIGDQYADWARRFGADRADAGRMGVAFGNAMREAPTMAFPGRSPEETANAERRWWHDLVRRVVAEAGLDDVLKHERFESFFAGLYDHFTTAEAWEAYPDVIPALRRLRDRGLFVGLITNYDTRVYSVLHALGLAPLLDSVTIPALVGAAKPDAAIFASALKAASVDPGQAVHVGDELGDDYSGAEKAGMTAILIDRRDRHAEKGLRRVLSLEELR